jgi:hypothetical protein
VIFAAGSGPVQPQTFDTPTWIVFMRNGHIHGSVEQAGIEFFIIFYFLFLSLLMTIDIILGCPGKCFGMARFTDLRLSFMTLARPRFCALQASSLQSVI